MIILVFFKFTIHQIQTIFEGSLLLTNAAPMYSQSSPWEVGRHQSWRLLTNDGLSGHWPIPVRRRSSS